MSARRKQNNLRAYLHSCGGWYAAREDQDGFHSQPSWCACWGWGECYDTPEVAISVARGDLPGDRPDGGSDDAREVRS